jgi:putative ABC transport system permease protein
MNSLITANVRQRPVRTIVSIIGIALGVCLIMLFTGLARGMSNDLVRRNSNLQGEIIFSKPASLQATMAAVNLSTKYADLLKTVDGVADAVPVIVYFFQDNKGFGLERVEGLDWEPFARMNDLRLVRGQAPHALDEIVVDTVKASDRNLSVGSTMKLFGKTDYRVTGIYTPEAGARTKMSLAALQDALEASGKCTYVLIKVRDHNQLNAVRDRIIAEYPPPGYKVQLTQDVFTSIEKNIPALGVFLRTLVGLSAIVSALVVMLAMYTTITERTREIGILKALGASRGYIIAVIEKEALLIGVGGLVAGFVVSFIAGFFIRRATGLLFEFGWKWALTASVIGLLGAAVGALYPAVRAANLDPVNALAYE